MAPVPDSMGDFSVLPVRMPETAAFAPATATTHFIYIRPSAPKIPTVDDERSLFLANVPADSTAEHFRALFAQLVGPGRLETITFEDERRQATGSEKGAALPAQAAQLASLESRKRKREGGEADESDESDEEEDKNDRKSRLPATWTHRLRRSGSTAVALLVDKRSIALVLKAVAKARRGTFPEWESNADNAKTVCGPVWLAAHNRMAYPDRAAVRRAVDAFFVQYNQREAQAAETARRLRNEPDADGFVTVTGGGGAGSSAARRAEAEAARAKQVAKQEKKATELTNFYRFQQREHRKEEQAELQRKFQEDRKRVAAMREKRGKFQPEV